MVRDRFGSDGAAKAFSLLLMVVAVAPMIAPLIGGWIVTVSWRAVFGVQSAFAVIILGFVFFASKETLPFAHRIQNRQANVLLQYRSLGRGRQLLAYTSVIGLMQSALLGYVVSAPVLLMDVYGVSPRYFGMIFFANTAGLIFSARINAALVGRFDPDRIMGVALLWPAALSLALIVAILMGFSSIYGVLVVFLRFLLGHGFISPNAAALGLAKQGARARTASAIMGAMQNGFGIAAIFVTSLFKISSALPLAMVMCGCTLLAIACHGLIARPERVRALRAHCSVHPIKGG